MMPWFLEDHKLRRRGTSSERIQRWLRRRLWRPRRLTVPGTVRHLDPKNSLASMRRWSACFARRAIPSNGLCNEYFAGSEGRLFARGVRVSVPPVCAEEPALEEPMAKTKPQKTVSARVKRGAARKTSGRPVSTTTLVGKNLERAVEQFQSGTDQKKAHEHAGSRLRPQSSGVQFEGCTPPLNWRNLPSWKEKEARGPRVWTREISASDIRRLQERIAGHPEVPDDEWV